MIVLQKEVKKYLGKNPLKNLEGTVQESVIKKLREYEMAPQEWLKGYAINSVIDYLFLQYWVGAASMYQISLYVRTSTETLKKIFDLYELPTLNNHEAVKRGASKRFGKYH